jgi:hypothetical protein
MKYIYHHLGLGDHIICNGLVRSLIKDEEMYVLFVKPHNRSTVEFMYRDLKNLSFIEGDDEFVNNFLKNNQIKREDIIVAGFYNHPNAKEFDETFYLQNNLPFILRWEKFYVNRDLEKEKSIFEKYNVTEDEYIFIHDDKDRGFIIDEKKILHKDLPIVRPIPGLTNNVFDYCYLMKNSIESHFIDSSFRLVFDSLKLRNTYIFYHINLLNGVIKDKNTKSQSFLDFILI